MAVNSNAPQSAVINTGAQQQQNHQPQQNRRAPFSMPTFGVRSDLGTLGSGGTEYEKLFEIINAELKREKDQSKGHDYVASKVMRNVYDLNYSAIAISRKEGQQVFAHTFIVEKTGQFPDRSIESSNNVRFDFMRTPAEAMDEKYASAVRSALSDLHGVNQDSVLLVDSTLVPNEFDYSNEQAVKVLLFGAGDAIRAETAIRMDNYTATNLASVVTADPRGKFVITMHFNNDDTVLYDTTGMPIRQDICVALSYRSQTQPGERSINQSSASMELVKVYGYIDFEFSPSTNAAQQLTKPQKFLPNFIITHMEAGDDQKVITPDLVMLGVISVMSTAQDTNWLQSFIPTAARKGVIDFNDIGALNIEGNIENSPTGFGVKYNTKSEGFSLQELITTAGSLVFPNLLVSIDVPKAGTSTWYTSIFHYIGIRGDKGATQRLISALSELSNGAFVGSMSPVFTPVVNKIHGGYYKSKQGIRDLRQLSSYLSVANFVAATNQSPALISAYTNTLYNSNVSMDYRVTERKAIIEEMSGNTCVYKQYYERLTFSAGFLTDVVAAVRSAGFLAQFSDSVGSTDVFTRRSTADFSSGVLDPNLIRVTGQQQAYVNNNMAYQYHRNYS